MQSGPNPLAGGAGSSSFTARRSAASALPTFELPPPPISNVHEAKYQSYSPTSGLPLNGSGSVSNIGNLLTPPNTIPGDGLSPTTAANIAALTNAAASQVANNLSYSHNGSWSSQSQQHPQQLAPSPSQQFSSSAHRQWIPPSGMYSPSSLNARGSDYGLPARNPQSNSNSDLYHLPPFNGPVTMTHPLNLPAMSMNPPQLPMSSSMGQQQQQQQHQMATNNQMPAMSAQEQQQYGLRLPPTPTYSNQPTSTSSPQHAQGPFSPSSASATSSGANTVRPPTSNSQHQIHSAPGSLDLGHALSSHQPASSYQRPYGQYSLPGASGGPQINGPVMTNMHAPNASMALVGGSMPANLMPPYPSGHAASLQAMYAAHGGHPGQGMASDRPFKCDQCMQSFNRNHDLKRHKRIHLAVKPYPCAHCDKSFSRKDALKRHMLVKGCGRVRTDSDHNEDGDGSSSSGSPQAISIPHHHHSLSR